MKPYSVSICVQLRIVYETAHSMGVHAWHDEPISNQNRKLPLNVLTFCESSSAVSVASSFCNLDLYNPRNSVIIPCMPSLPTLARELARELARDTRPLAPPLYPVVAAVNAAVVNPDRSRTGLDKLVALVLDDIFTVFAQRATNLRPKTDPHKCGRWCTFPAYNSNVVMNGFVYYFIIIYIDHFHHCNHHHSAIFIEV